MTQYVVLFRGINVGGHNKVVMKTLVAQLQQQGLEQVASYIQSGNLVLQCPQDPCPVIVQTVEEQFGFTPELLSLSADEFQRAAANNPYQELEGKTVHCYFCHSTIDPDLDKLKQYCGADESWHIADNTFYLHAPKGIGRSKLVTHIDACLQQRCTGRNLNTMNKLMAMLAAV